METIQTMASDLLINLALGIITLLGAYGMYYITRAAGKVREQTRQIKDQQRRQLLLDSLDDVETLATVTVAAIEQTTAKELREAVMDGKVSKDELIALSLDAFEDIKAKVAPEAQRVIADNLGSFDDYLTRLIESKVLEIKAATGQ